MKEEMQKNTNLKPNLHEALTTTTDKRKTTKNTSGKSQAGPLTTFRPIRERHVDTTLACRFEMKYLISEAKAIAIQRFVANYLPLDHYSKLQPGNSYPIVSLYLDSTDLQLCRESFDSILNRFKLRIRGYCDDPEYPKFVEIKRRSNFVIIKSRARLKTTDVPKLIAGQNVSPARNDPKDLDALNQFQLYMHSIKAKPIIRIRYLRKAYEGSSENRVRVTFDRQLAFNVTEYPEVILSGPGWQQSNVSKRGVVLEIKFTGRFPIWLSDMVGYFNLKSRSLSKYTTSVKNACLLGFCAPKLPIIT